MSAEVIPFQEPERTFETAPPKSRQDAQLIIELARTLGVNLNVALAIANGTGGVPKSNCGRLPAD